MILRDFFLSFINKDWEQKFFKNAQSKRFPPELGNLCTNRMTDYQWLLLNRH